MESIWHKTVRMPTFEPLCKDIEADAAVIGGGMAGILTACLLEMKGIDCVLIEANRIAGGVTGNTTAKITTQHDICYSTLIQQFGNDKATQYARANEQALELFGKLISEREIKCDYKKIAAHLYSTEDTKALEQEYKAAKSLGIDASLTDRTELPFKVKASLKFEGQAEFHPLKFLSALTNKIKIYEHTKALEVEDGIIITDKGKIRARNIVVATHFPFINTPGYYFMRMHQSRSYVLALDNAQIIKDAYIGIDGEKLSVRGWGETVLIGGGGHRTGENTTGGKYQILDNFQRKYWPESHEICRWSAQDCMTHDSIPYIGRYGANTPNLYVATGFRKWGMTGSMTAAMLLSDEIAGIPVQYDVFSPQRDSFAQSFKGLVKDGAVSVKGLSKQIFNIPHETLSSVECGKGDIVEHEGEKLGVYRDESGKTFLVNTACPHLGCQLTWNADEKSWDCPCHGSRFDYRGKLLNNPAQENATVTEENDGIELE